MNLSSNLKIDVVVAAAVVVVVVVVDVVAGYD